MSRSLKKIRFGAFQSSRNNVGFYTKKILPCLLDLAMTRPELGSHRRQLLSGVTGEILEIGFGTGANLPYYPKHVKEITAIDSNAGMTPFVQRRMKARGVQVKHLEADAHALPFPENAFDTIVTTWTLCSVENLDRVLHEISRVLRPGGKFYFLEHGRSPEGRVFRLQRLLNPLNRTVAGGCELTREISTQVKLAGFELERLENFYIEKFPRTHGYMFQGWARKSP